MIQITENAAKKLEALKKEEGRAPTDFLRVEVKKGGCSGLSYKMGFENEMKPGDKSFEHFGQKIVVDSEAFMYLVGDVA